MRPHQLLQSRRHRQRLNHAASVSAGALYRLPCDAHEAHSNSQAAICQSAPFLGLGPKPSKCLGNPLARLLLLPACRGAWFPSREEKLLYTLGYICIWLSEEEQGYRPCERPAVACPRVAMASGVPAAQAENLGETLIPVINRLQDIFSQASPSVRLPI